MVEYVLLLNNANSGAHAARLCGERDTCFSAFSKNFCIRSRGAAEPWRFLRRTNINNKHDGNAGFQRMQIHTRYVWPSTDIRAFAKNEENYR